MTVRFRSLAFLIYVVIGIIVAWDRGYIFYTWLKTTASILNRTVMSFSAPLQTDPRPRPATPGRGTGKTNGPV